MEPPSPPIEDALPELEHMHAETPSARVEIAKEARKAARTRQLDLDVRGILALIALMGAMALSFTELFVKGTTEIPQWAASMVAAIVGFYFGARGGGTPDRKNGQ